jgi:putative ABC transport system ATP-binding protein
LVWADEPTGNLDSQTAAAVLDLLLAVHRSGQTLVIVTHDRVIGARGQRLVQVRDGRIVADGDPGTVLSNGTVRNDGHHNEAPVLVSDTVTA